MCRTSSALSTITGGGIGAATGTGYSVAGVGGQIGAGDGAQWCPAGIAEREVDGFGWFRNSPLQDGNGKRSDFLWDFEGNRELIENTAGGRR
jgi:hypothetical protein